MRIKSLQLRARVVVEGFIKGIHRSPITVLGRVQRIPPVHPGRRPALSRLAALRPLRPLLRQAVRGRDQPPLLPRAGHQPVDGLSARARTTRASTPAPRRPRSPTSSPSSATRSACSPSRTGSPTTCPRGTARATSAGSWRCSTASRQGARDRPRGAARADRRDRPEAGPDRPDLRPARAGRGPPHQAGLPAVPGPRGDRPARPRPGRGRVHVRRRRPCSTTWNRGGSSTSTRTPPAPDTSRRFAAHAAEIERACADLGDRLPVDHHRLGRWSLCSSTS